MSQATRGIAWFAKVSLAWRAFSKATYAAVRCKALLASPLHRYFSTTTTCILAFSGSKALFHIPTLKCRHLAVQTLCGVLLLGINMPCKVAERDGNRSATMLKGTQRFLVTMALQLSTLESITTWV